MSGMQLVTASDMGDTYANNIAPMIKNNSRVVITDSDGKSESIIVNIAEYEAIREAAWEMYVQKALVEVEAAKDDPSTWISLEDFWKD
jgi:hypothetical protein